MINRLFRSGTLGVIFALGAAYTAPIGLAAQEAAAFQPALLTIAADDGQEDEYRVADVGAFLSFTSGYDDVPSGADLSLSLTGVSPIDDELLEWARLVAGETGAVRTLTIVTEAEGSGDGREVKYEISEAIVTSISFTHSAYAEQSVSLTITASTLTVNGIRMN